MTATTEHLIEQELIATLENLKYVYRPDIRDRSVLEKNFRDKFESLNRVSLSDAEFQRLLEKIITTDVFAAAKTLREYDTIERDDGTPFTYSLVNIKDWCKNSFEVINQLRINTDNSHHRYDVLLLINGVPVVQIELKSLDVSPRRAMQQIVDYKNDPGNGYGKTLLCFIQLFIVSNRSETRYFANNNSRHFVFNAEERFLPIYQLADEDNKKVSHLEPFAEKFLSKCTLGQMISRYMVLVASEQKLLIMRPYQIYAVKAIIDCIHQNCGNGYFLHRSSGSAEYTLRATDETPLFHHVALLSEIQTAASSGVLYTYHFNMLRGILEKTAIFFGHDNFSACLHGLDDEVLYARALNLLSHGKYAIYEPREMVEDTKQLFRKILSAFVDRYEFALPSLLAQSTTPTESSS